MSASNFIYLVVAMFAAMQVPIAIALLMILGRAGYPAAIGCLLFGAALSVAGLWWMP